MLRYWDLDAEAWQIAIDRVILPSPRIIVVRPGVPDDPLARRFWFRTRFERLRLLAAVARGDREYVR